MLSTHTTEGVYEVPFIPSEYYSETSILGKPLNIFASVENKFHFELGKFKNRISIGSNLKTDVNFGLGRIVTFDETNSIFPSSSLRPRPYKDIPALNQFSVFLEDEISKEIFSRLFQLQIGLRYDNIQPLGLFKGEFGTTLLPRLNMKYHVSDAIKIRAAYGKSSKAPSLIYLYPDVAYFDMQSYQYYYPDNPELSRAFISTKILQIDNSNIRSSINEK